VSAVSVRPATVADAADEHAIYAPSWIDEMAARIEATSKACGCSDVDGNGLIADYALFGNDTF